jgi:hypothetical protein
VVRKGFLQLSHLFPAPDALVGLGYLDDVVLVAHRVLLSGAWRSLRPFEKATRPQPVHLFQVGHLLSIHKALLRSTIPVPRLVDAPAGERGKKVGRMRTRKRKCRRMLHGWTERVK